MKPPTPIRLQWDLSDRKLVAAIEEAYEDSQKLIDVSFNAEHRNAFYKELSINRMSIISCWCMMRSEKAS